MGRVGSILIIEDNAAEARLYAGILTGTAAYASNTLIAATHAEAVQHLKDASFDAILLDMNLPDVSGFENFQSVYSHRGSAPVVVLTSIEDTELTVRLLQSGAQDYLYKPELTPTMLCRALDYAMARNHVPAPTGTQQTADTHTVCSCCKRVKLPAGQWQQIETYIAKQFGIYFSHTVCPECVASFYPEFDKRS